jgi:hypothetical protein
MDTIARVVSRFRPRGQAASLSCFTDHTASQPIALPPAHPNGAEKCLISEKLDQTRATP